MAKKSKIRPDEFDSVDYALKRFPKVKADFGKMYPYPDLQSVIKFDKNDLKY